MVANFSISIADSNAQTRWKSGSPRSTQKSTLLLIIMRDGFSRDFGNMKANGCKKQCAG
jgi:hypothetical protein